MTETAPVPSSPEPIRISAVVPVYNEAESLRPLTEELTRALSSMGVSYEILFVDDCSTDGSLRVLLELRRQDRHIRIVRFRRNFGQTAGMAAGFDHARGELVVTLDGDLQNDPADIPAMVKKLEEGWDIVAGWRRKREDGFLLRRLPSIVANRLIGLYTGVSIHDTGCTLKVFRAQVLRGVSLYSDQHRFLPVVYAGAGARVTEMEVNHRSRRFGSSKYGLSRATRVLLDLLSIKLIAQFSQRPLHYFGVLSLTFFLFALFFVLVGLIGVENAFQGDASALASFNRWELPVVSIVILLMMLVVYFALLGLLGELAVKASGMHKRGTLDRLLNELH
ncbi:Undecaprenyl-phosphate 4-deoxy-4-formamido-L-arabinose transferase [Planctomycetes bacterium Pla163]|uniref:Undecaprenyl-phosphate 4-deoxy-4-formamido-L-arabinose transferase n=1 Tax=Rohdeia mirabilis TaxID=2528008 RepID=A0A518D0C6_9BACT|nr:Undecaprenyl-phosphate 4-deoxy-4-formamido-L-arabinose transferase [Planctomycetes bacterium Pla163]